MRFSEPCRQALEAAAREARRLGQPAVGMEHLLLALLRDETCTAAALLRDEGADPSRLRRWLESRLPKAAMDEWAGTGPSPAGSATGANRLEDLDPAGQVVRPPPAPERLPRTAALQWSVEWALEEAREAGPTRELLPGEAGHADVGTEHLLLGLLLHAEHLLFSHRVRAGGSAGEALGGAGVDAARVRNRVGRA